LNAPIFFIFIPNAKQGNVAKRYELLAYVYDAELDETQYGK